MFPEMNSTSKGLSILFYITVSPCMSSKMSEAPLETWINFDLSMDK